ncbi:MAG TPA: transglutaminase, partial [Shewanella frigidimarina]|nr:transglutaminase [Shewanella frigidimarina]
LLINEPHMVLIYFEDPKAMPLVLDNLKTKILPANQRRDLKPIYS